MDAQEHVLHPSLANEISRSEEEQMRRQQVRQDNESRRTQIDMNW